MTKNNSEIYLNIRLEDFVLMNILFLLSIIHTWPDFWMKRKPHYICTLWQNIKMYFAKILLFFPKDQRHISKNLYNFFFIYLIFWYHTSFVQKCNDLSKFLYKKILISDPNKNSISCHIMMLWNNLATSSSSLPFIQDVFIHHN